MSDLHGNQGKYSKLAEHITSQIPDIVFIGGDILPNYQAADPFEFINEYLRPLLINLKNDLGEKYPRVFLITGNDDPAICYDALTELEREGLFHFINEKILNSGEPEIMGYHYIPPTPFLLKDSEKYDVSQFVPRGSVSPEEGIRTVEIPGNIVKFASIKNDLNVIANMINDFKKTICLFHSPPYETNLDKMTGVDITGKKETVSVGSIAIRKFIEKHQPLVTLHGHIHESSEISGSWKDKIGETWCFNASICGDQLAVIEFDIDSPGSAERVLLK